MVEDQTFDRVHCIGQTNEVITFRYVISNALEEVCYLLYNQFYGILTPDFGCPENPLSAIDDNKFGRARICACRTARRLE